MSETRTAGVRPWGRAATFALGVGALLAGQAAALIALSWWYGKALADMPDFSGDGVAVIIVILVSTPVQVGLLALMARQTGAGVADYLGLIVPRRADFVIGIAAVVAFVVVGNTVSWLLGANIVTGFQSDIYRTASAAGVLPLLWFTVVVATPIGEEVLFRGFLFRGWHRTPRDGWIVIVATALVWALIHVQYEPFVVGQIFLAGVMLGWFRWATGSTLLAIVLHALINTEGMIETVLFAPG